MSASLEANRVSNEFFPTPYSIRDPQVLDVMRRVNMDLIDEQLKVYVLTISFKIPCFRNKPYFLLP
jgi:hypothetical protein